MDSTDTRPEPEVPTRAVLLKQLAQLRTDDLEVLADECEALVRVRRKEAAAGVVPDWLRGTAKDAITKALVAHRLVWEASSTLKLIGQTIDDQLIDQAVSQESFQVALGSEKPFELRDEALRELMQATRWDDLMDVLMASGARIGDITASMPVPGNEVTPDELDRRYAPEGSALIAEMATDVG